MATFLLGAWLAGGIFMAAISLTTLRAPNLVMMVPHPEMDRATRLLGWEQTAAIVRHVASEQARFILRKWELVQLLLAMSLLACLFLGTQRRILPMLLCGIMLVMVLFQLNIFSELSYRGKETDFPPGSTALGPTTRYLMLEQVHIGTEIMKYIAGIMLAGFLFIFRTSRRRISMKDVDPVNDPDHSHVDG
jgi:hypothetical protein